MINRLNKILIVKKIAIQTVNKIKNNNVFCNYKSYQVNYNIDIFFTDNFY